MDTSKEPKRDNEEAILKLIDGDSHDSSQAADEVSGLVNDIKGLWLLAKMASASRSRKLNCHHNPIL